MDSREAVLEAEIRRLKAQNRQLVDELEDAEEAARVYRRLAHRLLVERDRGQSQSTAMPSEPE